ncbi:hypothetical protein GCM10029964_071280 [Kibdelosporangium lantanae]
MAAMCVLPATATAATPPRILVHYDLAAGQQPENVAVEPRGDLDVTLATALQVERVTPQGERTPLATLPKPADGGVHTPILGFPIATGIVRARDGVLYVGYASGDATLTGIWRVSPGIPPRRVIPFPANSFPNGMALTGDTLYVADSALGKIWRASVCGGEPTTWATGPALEATSGFAANGLKIHNDAIWASNTTQGTLLRVPIRRDGSAGEIQPKATGLTAIDDFAFNGETVVAALNFPNQVALVHSDGTTTTLLTGDNGLRGPTSVAVDHGHLYVMSASYILQNDPNILVADLP